MSTAWRNRSAIMTAAQSLAPMLLLEEGDDESREIAIKANYVDKLSDACVALQALTLQNPFLDVKPLEDILITEREKVRKYPGRLIPLTPVINKSSDACQLEP